MDNFPALPLFSNSKPHFFAVDNPAFFGGYNCGIFVDLWNYFLVYPFFGFIFMQRFMYKYAKYKIYTGLVHNVDNFVNI